MSKFEGMWLNKFIDENKNATIVNNIIKISINGDIGTHTSLLKLIPTYCGMGGYMSIMHEEDKYMMWNVKYTSQGNPLGTSPHFKDGTQGKIDFTKAQCFSAICLLKISTCLLRELDLGGEDNIDILNHTC